jgi:hypothetical protein
MVIGTPTARVILRCHPTPLGWRDLLGRAAISVHGRGEPARCPPSLIAEGGPGLGRSPGEGPNSSRDCNGPGSCSRVCATFSIGSLLFLLLGLAVLYGVIRLAVRDGIRDANRDRSRGQW